MKSSPKMEMARLLPLVNRRLTVGVAALTALTGLLPVAIILTTGAVVGAIPRALGEGLSSPAGGHALRMLILLGSCFVALQATSTARVAAGSSLGWQLNRFLEQRVMSAAAAPAGTAHLEDPASLVQIAAARDVVFGGYRPCDAVPALAGRVSAWLQGAGSGVVLATYRWWIGLLVFGAWAWRAEVFMRWHAKGMKTIGVNAPALRRGEYLRDLVLTPGAAKEVRVFGLTAWLVDRYRRQSAVLFDQAAAERDSATVITLVTTVAAVSASLAALIMVGLATVDGKLSLGGLALYASAIIGIPLVVHVGMDNLMLEFGSAHVPAVAAMEEALARPAGDGAVPPAGAPRAEIRFEGVGFRYPGADHDALTHLDLVLPAGKSVAVVGANGAGKTTLVKLLCRFYEPDHGRINVDGEPLASFEPGAWQRHVAAVFQDFVRYPVSARDNIAFGAVGAAGDVEAAAERVGARDALAALPHGFDTLLAPGYQDGTDLSGGQWQRLVLARALYAASAGAPVLVLDEPAANLDARGEAELYERFLDITRGVTTLVISHRFSTVRHADLIYVLDGGRVVEQGNHDQLVALGGIYAGMFIIQAERLLGA